MTDDSRFGSELHAAWQAFSDDDDVLTWAEIVEHCSRLHTTRRRPMGPWADAEEREDSQMLDVWIDDAGHKVEAVVVPTRMHEPGFYVRSPNHQDYWLMRDEPALQRFRADVDAGKVRRR